LSLNDRAWVGAKDQLATFNTWIEAITHDWEKEPNKSIVFLLLGIKQTSKIHAQLLALWKTMAPSITIIRVGGGKIGMPPKTKKGGMDQGGGEDDLTLIDVYNPLSLFHAISTIDQNMRQIVQEFNFRELEMPTIE
jgi:hypothetical protein